MESSASGDLTGGHCRKFRPPAAVPSDPVNALLVAHDAQGLHVHARTAMPSWPGDHLDVAYAIDVLHPLARPDIEEPATQPCTSG